MYSFLVVAAFLNIHSEWKKRLGFFTRATQEHGVTVFHKDSFHLHLFVVQDLTFLTCQSTSTQRQ